MERSEYRRARTPEQKLERRRLILDTAREMLDENQDSNALSLNELARRMGMAKSNVYRYFESREAVLLELLSMDWSWWLTELEELIQSGSAEHQSAEEVVRTLARSAVDRPRMCHLISVMPSILERNVSMETVRAFKHGALGLVHRLTVKLNEAAPELKVEQYKQLVRHATALIVGLWPLSRPNDVLAEVLESPGLRVFRYDFESELTRALVSIARGMQRS